MKKAVVAISILLCGLCGFAQSVKLGLSSFSEDSSGLALQLKRSSSELDKLPSERLTTIDVDIENQVLSVPNKKVQLEAFWRLGFYLREHHFYLPAMRLIENALTLSHEIPSAEDVDITNTLADLYSKVGEPGKALDVLTSQLVIFEQRRDLEAEVKSRSLLIELYYRNDELTKCLVECRKVDSIARKIPGGPKGYVWNIWINSWNTSGMVWYKRKAYEKALVYYDSTKRIARRKGDEFMVGLVVGNSALIYRDMGNFPKAIEGAEYDIRLSKKAGELHNAANSAIMLCNIYLKTHQYDQAKAYLDSAKLWHPPGFDSYARQYYTAKSKFAAAKHNFDEAYQYQLKANEVRDSIDKVLKPINLTKAISKASLAERERNIELLKNKSLLQEQQLEFRNLLIISASLVLSLLLFSSVVFYRRYHEKRRDGLILQEKNNEIESMLEEIQSQHEMVVNQKEEIETLNTSLEELVRKRTLELEKKNQELDTFIYRASHDIRRPISTILGLDNVFKLLVKDPVADEIFGLVATTAKSMDSMLYKMRMIYELNQVDDSREKIWINQFVQKAIVGFEQDLHKKEIDLRTECHNVAIEANEALLSIVVKNLIENSIQFTRPDLIEKPFIRIACQPQADQVIITFEDNGIGIEEDHLPKIFDLYFRGSSRSNGNGLGLYLVKKALERMGGSIAVQSTFGKGTKFTIAVPLIG
jgi:signal transduction histidine kinase